MKKIFFLFYFLLSLPFLAQQEEDAWVFFKDKPHKNNYLNNPLQMLSEKAILRRNVQNITLDEKDVPIFPAYYNQLKNEKTITVLSKSKWLNAVHVIGLVDNIKALKNSYSFIESITFANKTLHLKETTSKFHPNIQPKKELQKQQATFNYGATANQIEMLNGHVLHEKGFTGKGQHIAIMDGGFINVNTLPAFKRLRDNNQILGGYNFVKRNSDFYSGSSHGTAVLSTIGGYLENSFVGAAPNASFYLFLTEDTSREVPLEESLWVEAAEKADSLGVDIINTSLGYSTFDKPKYNYKNADMDGKTSFITRGAQIATSRGILVVVSNGNEGHRTWKYVTAPADAQNVISVGAVDAQKNIANFSSFGITASNRLKPEIVAQGRGTAVVNAFSGAVVSSNGTSFSAPIISGLLACLNQFKGFLKEDKRNTTINNLENKNLIYYLKKAVYESADKFNKPEEQYGYGIPDFKIAYTSYIENFVPAENELQLVTVFPNPFKNELFVNIPSEKIALYGCKIVSILGQTIYKEEALSSKKIDFSFLKNGVYILQISKNNAVKNIKLIKK